VTVPTLTVERRRAGRSTILFPSAPAVRAAASVAGPLEGQGPLRGRFDQVVPDRLMGQDSWEKAERLMLERAVRLAAERGGVRLEDVDLLLAGDLLNQIITSSFAARDLDVPFLGLYSACATLTAGLALAAALVDGGHARRAAVAVASHHDSAERQYRFPTEFGNQRPPTATWTATGAAAVLVSAGGEAGEDGDGAPNPGGGGRTVRIRSATVGRVVDMGVKDPYDMGSAMAPAAADTIRRHLEDTGRRPDDYDLIITGDLGRVGRPLCQALLEEEGYRVAVDDCGLRLYDPKRQDVHAGGSGAACSGLVFAADVLPALREGRLRRVLLVSTGALHSTTTYQQGESIPGVAHAVCLEAAADGEG
jgi:stage V sporulation protein AD